MRRSRRPALFAWLSAAAGVLLSGCLSASIAGDVADVRAHARVPLLAEVADVGVAPGSEDDARALLERPLDAEAAVQIALLNNRALRAQLRELGVARGRLIQARQIENPVFEVESLPERNTAVELRVEVDITSMILAPLRAKAAAADLAAARLDAAGAVIQLGYEVRVAFYDLQAASQRLELASRALETFAAAREAAEALLAAGNIAELDAASQISAHEKARVLVAQLELEVADRREALQRLLGLHGEETRWEIAAALPPVPDDAPDVAGPETRAIEASLELAALRRRLDAIARRTKLSRTEGWVPEIGVDVHSLHGDPELAAGAGGPLGVGAGVSLTVPLFNQQRGTTRAHEAEFDALLERFHGAAIDIRSAAREARNRVSSTHTRALHYQDVIVPAQQRVVDQTLLQYNAMQLGVFELLQAHRDLLEVELAKVEVMRAYWSAVAAQDALLAGGRVALGDGGTTLSIAGSEPAGGH